MRTQIVWLCIAACTFLVKTHVQIASAQQGKRPFTLADEVGLTLFDDPRGGPAKILFSPDRKYFAVWTERGLVDLNCVEDSLRIYNSDDIEDFLQHSSRSLPPMPVWVVDRSNKEGSIINDWRWLSDSSGIAFLDGGGDFGNKRLVLADLRNRLIEPLTSPTEAVGTFDVRDREHYVYTAYDWVERDKMQEQKARAEAQAVAIVGTGLSLEQLLFPGDGTFVPSPARQLWAVIHGKHFQVQHDGAPVVPGDLALSPDGRSLVTTLPVREIPLSWETLYPPPFESSPYRIRAGHDRPAHQYVSIDLQTGSVHSLVEAPTGVDAGWWGGESPSWSADGHAVLLPNTFLHSRNHMPSSPCVAVVDLISGAQTCVEMLKRQTNDKDYYLVLVTGAAFVQGNRKHVIVNTYQKSSYQTVDYQLTSQGTWQVHIRSASDLITLNHNDLEVVVKEGLDEPPLLIAHDKRRLRVIWNPNPQIANIDLGNANVYRWKDKEGKELTAGLYKPVGYESGRRYPLVIQTHGFRESEFRPSGFFTTGFAARLLAAAGMFVLQIGEQCPYDTPSEGPCAMSDYESAVSQLVSEGLVDTGKIGIIGFSRTCFYVMEALTASSVHFKAALITDGWMASYLQYLTTIDVFQNELPRQFDSMIGAPPFGEGLQQWLERSPSFRLHQITTPLLVVAEGRNDLLFMWEPYAGLRHLHKPVDLIILNTDEHVLTTPGVRLASQGASIDWFRFWLKNEEDSDPSKIDQYARWHQLRESGRGDHRSRSNK